MLMRFENLVNFCPFILTEFDLVALFIIIFFLSLLVSVTNLSSSSDSATAGLKSDPLTALVFSSP